MNTFYKTYVPFLMLMICSTAFAQMTSSKSIHKTYEINNTGALYLDNKYGDITINGWDKETIEIKIDIEAIDKKNENSDAILDRIQPKFKVANNYVNIVSEIEEKKTSFFSKYFNKINPFEPEKSNIAINYTINLPANCDVEIVNKFGDLIFNDWSGKLKATVNHGDVWLNESIKSATIDVKFGKLRAKAINFANIVLKNGNIELEEAKYLNLKTSGTNITIDQVEELEISSNKDNAVFNYIKNIEGSLRFSSLKIEVLENEIDLNTKITDLEILKIKQPNSKIRLEQTSSNITINISGTSFVFDANLEQGTLKLPKSFNDVNTSMIDEGKRIRTIKASYGTPKNGIFSITGKKGSITLME